MQNMLSSLPHPGVDMAGKVILLEAIPGSARQNILRQWAQEAEQAINATTWCLACNFTEGGIWAGLQDLLQEIVPEVESRSPELLLKHSYELCLAAPLLQRTIAVRNPNLTDTAEGGEHVRNYPADRAYRIPHGLIDFLAAWYQSGPQRPLIITCDCYDQSSPFIQRFFTEFVRRRGADLQLTLFLAVTPGQGERLAAEFPSEACSHIVQMELLADPPTPISAAGLLQVAQTLEQQVQEDPIVADIFMPRLIDLWEQSGNEKAALSWKVRAAHRFNHLGLYEVSLWYCSAIEASLDQLRQDDLTLFSDAVAVLYFCYLPLGRVKPVYTLITEKVINWVRSQPALSNTHYLLAMLYARFLPERDLQKASEHLELGIALLGEADLPDPVRYFYIVFLMNGLAYVRTQQRQAQAAITLCQEGFALLDRYLPPVEHRLHRSVLIYNIAQVYAATGQIEAALDTFARVIEMDPYYSEYYNERGAIYFKAGHLHEAEQDYLQAVELSPPYAEVWINLGQCYREMERTEESIAAYSRALDLSPEAVLPLVGRAEMYAEADQLEAALADYNLALQLDSQQPLVLAARAVVYYGLDQLELAVDDLDQAIVLAPDNALFYQNRAIALLDLDRLREAKQDLQMYLQLQPDAEDRSEIEERLLPLQSV